MADFDVRLQTNINDEFIFLKSDTEFNFLFQTYSQSTLYYKSNAEIEYGINWGTDPLNLNNNSTYLSGLFKDYRDFMDIDVYFPNNIFDAVAPNTPIFIEPYFIHITDETVSATGIVYEINSDLLVQPQKILGGTRLDEDWRNTFYYDAEQVGVTNIQLEISSTPTFDTITNVVSVYSVQSGTNLLEFVAEYLEPGIKYYRLSANYDDVGVITTTPIEFDISFKYEIPSVNSIKSTTTGGLEFTFWIYRNGGDKEDANFTVGIDVKSVDGATFNNVYENTVLFDDYNNMLVTYLVVARSQLEEYANSAKDIVYRTYYINSMTNETFIGEEVTTNIDFPVYITPTQIKSLTGVDSAERIHGSLIYDGFVYGSSRNKTGLVKIEEANLSNVKNFVFFNTQLNETNSQYPLSGLEQVCRIDNYLYMKSDRYVIQFDTVTEEYKTFYGGTLIGGQPLVVDESFIYTPIEEDPINFAGMKWLKISHSKIVNASYLNLVLRLGNLKILNPKVFMTLNLRERILTMLQIIQKAYRLKGLLFIQLL